MKFIAITCITFLFHFPTNQPLIGSEMDRIYDYNTSSLKVSLSSCQLQMSHRGQVRNMTMVDYVT